MKSFSDLEQSKKLAEILPLESADMHYWWKNLKLGVGHSKELQEGFESRGIDYTPCWSLAALLNVLELPTLEKCNIGKDKTGWMITVYHNNSRYDSFFYNEPVDACYEVILKLNELKML
jgi:hypothetical protein